MSSEFDRTLRDARESLPLPDEATTERARRRVLARLPGKQAKTKTRVLVLAGATLVVALALGVTAGSLNAPSGTAAREPAILGFVPEPGWFALQSPPPAVPGQQTVAVAANIPFAADDVVHGLVEPSGLPYSTLLSLPPRGIVIVATMTPQTEPHLAPVPINTMYPKAELPLRIRDGVTYLQWGALVRPDQPLAQYQLKARIQRHDVDVLAYFGVSHPTEAQLDAAQRQLDGLVIRSVHRAPSVARTTATTMPALSVVDRTYACNTVPLGGLYRIESRAHAGRRVAGEWSKLPYAVVSSGGWAGLLVGYPYPRDNSLAWITAAKPTRQTTADSDGESFPVLSGGTLGVNKELCRPAKVRVELGPAGLRGGAISPTGRVVRCDAPKRVMVRLRAVARSSPSFHERAGTFLATNATIRDAKLAVRTPAGKLLSYADVSESGQARHFTAKGCTPG